MKWIVLMVLAMANNSAAAEWVRVGRSADDGFDYYAETATVRRSGGRVKMWLLYDYQAPQAVYDQRYLSSKLQVDYDCNGNKLRINYAITHSANMGNGNAVAPVDSPAAAWESISPGSGDEVLWKFACGHGT